MYAGRPIGAQGGPYDRVEPLLDWHLLEGNLKTEL